MSHFGCVCVCGYSAVNIKWTGPLCHTLGVCVCGYSAVNIKWTGPLCHTLGVFVYVGTVLLTSNGQGHCVTLWVFVSFLFVSGQIQFIFCSWLQLMLIFTWYVLNKPFRCNGKSNKRRPKKRNKDK